MISSISSYYRVWCRVEGIVDGLVDGIFERRIKYERNLKSEIKFAGGCTTNLSFFMNKSNALGIYNSTDGWPIGGGFGDIN